MSRSIADHCRLPTVSNIHIGPIVSGQNGSSKFAALVLEDNSVGVTYVALDDAHEELIKNNVATTLVGCNPVELCELYVSTKGWQRALGMAAINAISRYLIKRSKYLLQDGDKTASSIVFNQSDVIGMVGFFPPLVEQISALGIALIVVELDKSLVHDNANYYFSTDNSALKQCSKVICTGTTLINHSIDDILSNCANADEIHIIGPSVGCLPDPLFERGVTSIGGRIVADSQKFIDRWQCSGGWKKVSDRYIIKAVDYPGHEALIRRALDF